MAVALEKLLAERVRILKVSKRGGFSDRNKIKPENEEIQLMMLLQYLTKL
jgi:hypothetical protein